MSATVEINGIRATIKGYHWTSRNKELQHILNAALDPYGPSGADPNPDLTAAQETIDRLGGQLIEFDEVATEPGTIH